MYLTYLYNYILYVCICNYRYTHAPFQGDARLPCFDWFTAKSDGGTFQFSSRFFAPKPGVSITASQVLCFLILCV